MPNTMQENLKISQLMPKNGKTFPYPYPRFHIVVAIIIIIVIIGNILHLSSRPFSNNFACINSILN